MEFDILSLVKNFVYVLVGILFYTLNIIYLITSFPLYFYKWFIVNIGAPYFRGRDGKVVCNLGQAFAAELVHPNPDISPRCTILVSVEVEGNVSCEEITSAISENLLKAEKKPDQLLYPELQQYPEQWMGLIFWSQDENFRLQDHLIVHEVTETGSDHDFDEFLSQLNEKLLNAKWKPRKSPWEIHLVKNIKGSKETSIIILRMHHMMSDGFGIWALLLKLFKCPDLLPLATFTKPSQQSLTFRNLISGILFPVKLFLDAGYFCSLGLQKRTIYHIPDNKKAWTQILAKAPAISVQRIKFIKNKFGVSFASVLNSAVAAALGKMMKILNEAGPTHMVLGNAVPRPNHPKNLYLHLLGVAFKVPIRLDMDPIERLYECQEQASRAVQHPFPLISGIFMDIYSGQLACCAKLFLENRFLATAISSFFAAGSELTYNGKKLTSVDFTAGLMDGVAGLAIMALSHSDQLRVCATAEKGLMSKEQVNHFLRLVVEEIKLLHELALLIK